MNKRSSFFPSLRAGALAGVTVAALILTSVGARAQVTGSTQTTTDANGQPQETVTMSASPSNSKKSKEDKVVQSKDTKKHMQAEKKTEPVAAADAKLPDRQLYDKALAATKKGTLTLPVSTCRRC